MATSRRTNQRLTLLMLVLASVTALTLDYRGTVAHGITHVRNGVHDALSPIQRGISFVLNPVGDVFAGAVHYGSLKTQNEQLRSELGNLRRELETDRYAGTQSEKVLDLANLPYVSGIPWVPAEVIGDATSNFQETLEIDKGTSEGAGPGMPVVGESGLVGVISTASSSTSTIVLVTDPSSSIAVHIGATGLYRAEGGGRGRGLKLSYVGGSTAAKSGELVYT
ncbi:MAG: rod shape-determining protein MreC, partial [Acidimicrobiales bacterium]